MKIRITIIVIFSISFIEIFSQQNFQILSSIQTSLYEHSFGGIITGVDFDQDGKMDLYACNHNLIDDPSELIPRLYKFEWNGTYWEMVWMTEVDIPLQNTWPALAWGDLDGDGKPEIYWGPINFTDATLNPNPARILVYEYPGDGSDNMGVSDGFGGFLPNASTTLVNENMFNLRPTRFIISDVDGDGDDEIIFVDRAAAFSEWHFGVVSVDNIPDDGNGLETWTVEANGLGNSILAGTGNKWDVAVLNNYIYLWDGIGQIFGVRYQNNVWEVLEPQSGLAGDLSSFKGSVVVDIDGDGTKEIVVGGLYAGAKVYVLKQVADTLLSFMIADLSTLGGVRLNGAAVGDLDGNGKVDFVFGSRYDILNTVNNQVFRVAYQGGDITSPSSYISTVIDSFLLPLGGDLDVITIANVHGDSKDEVIYTQGYSRGNPTNQPGDVRIIGIDSTATTIIVTSPNGGENWLIGELRNITWASSNISNVKIEYTTNNGASWINIISSTSATLGSYNWTVSNTPSAQCKVRITDTSNPVVYDESNGLFTISAAANPLLTVVSPNGGEHYTPNSPIIINWVSQDITNISIEYSSNNGASWNNIISSTPANAGSYNWTAPNISSTQSLIKICDIANLSFCDQSDSTFTIAPIPDITVIQPNGGEVWQAGSNKNITWSSNYVIDVKIELSINNGGSWTDVIASTPSTGLYAWSVPNNPSLQSLIKISDVTDPNVFDISDNVFTIDHPSSVEDWFNSGIPTESKLYQNFPNPFNPNTTIYYSIAEEGSIKLSVYNLLGEVIVELANEYKNPGNYLINFNFENYNSGIYLYKLQAGSFVETKKMILLK